MNLPDLIEQFRSEDKCREYLEDLRWPDGVRCPRCGNDSVSWIEKRKQHECNEESCRYQFSVTAGTVFHDSHLPLWKWFLAIYLIGESKKGISAKQLQRTLGVSYKTAWYLGHRVRSAMEDGSPVPLQGIVEIDETWIGGRKRQVKGQSNRSNKSMVLDEMAFRFNNRDNAYLFRDTLLRMIEGETLPYEDLVAAKNHS